MLAPSIWQSFFGIVFFPRTGASFDIEALSMDLRFGHAGMSEACAVATKRDRGCDKKKSHIILPRSILLEFSSPLGSGPFYHNKAILLPPRNLEHSG